MSGLSMFGFLNSSVGSYSDNLLVELLWHSIWHIVGTSRFAIWMARDLWSSDVVWCSKPSSEESDLGLRRFTLLGLNSGSGCGGCRPGYGVHIGSGFRSWWCRSSRLSSSIRLFRSLSSDLSSGCQYVGIVGVWFCTVAVEWAVFLITSGGSVSAIVTPVVDALVHAMAQFTTLKALGSLIIFSVCNSNNWLGCGLVVRISSALDISLITSPIWDCGVDWIQFTKFMGSVIGCVVGLVFLVLSIRAKL